MFYIPILCDSHHKNYNIYLFILPSTHLYKHLTLGLGCLYKHRHYYKPYSTHQSVIIITARDTCINIYMEVEGRR